MTAMEADASKIVALLKQTDTTHYDKDERFMAICDLQTELEKIEDELNDSLQIQICEVILKQLNDSSHDIQSISCALLSSIAKRLNCQQIEDVMYKLATTLVCGKQNSRGIYSMALKNIITSTPKEFGTTTSKKILKLLLDGVKTYNNVDLAIVCLYILKHLIMQFGVLLSDDHSLILQTVQPLLENRYIEIRNKSSTILGVMISIINDNQLHKLMHHCINKMTIIQNHNIDKISFTFIKLIGIFARNEGYKISPYLKDFVPLLITIIKDIKSIENNTSGSQLMQNCLQTFNVLVFQCPMYMSLHSKELINIALKSMTLDPNYDYNEINEDDDKDDWDDDWNDGNDMQLELIEDIYDDTFCKVRHAAVRLLISLIKIHQLSIQKYYIKICDALLDRFKERDVMVRLEIFTAFQELLLVATQRRNTSLCQLISHKLPCIMKQVYDQFKSLTKDTKVIIGLMNIIKNLVFVVESQKSAQHILATHFTDLLPYLETQLTHINQNDIQLRLCCLDMLYVFLQKHQNEDCLKVIKSIYQIIVDGIKFDHVEIQITALNTVPKLTEIIRPYYSEYDRSYDDVIAQLFNVSFAQLALNDASSNVKNAAIKAMTSCLERFGDHFVILKIDLAHAFNILKKQLSNGNTRKTALKCFIILCKSPLDELKIYMSSVVNEIIEKSISFIKIKQHYELKKLATTTSHCILLTEKISDKLLLELIKKYSQHINDSNLDLLSLIVNLFSLIIEKNHNSLQIQQCMINYVFPNCYKLFNSCLLQGT
eukprot:331043_1